jgi:pyridoxal phosphate enzyme (YggS family)
MSFIEKNYREIVGRMEAAAKGRPVTLIAVSKMQSAEAVEALYRLGHRDFGENYAQELAAKATALQAAGCTDIRWHFIGHLQTNKAKQIVPHITAIHSVDSLKLGQELAKRWKAAGRVGRLPIFIEVNIDNQASKSGCAISEVPALAGVLAGLPELELQGLMCIPDPDLGATDVAFNKLRELELKCRPHTKGQLSMGMTQDFEAAITSGATHVRVGTALFGARPPRPTP